MLLGEDIHEREPPALDERVRDRLAAVLLELGLVVEELELARSAGHEQVDHALGPGREMARAEPPADCAARRPRPVAAGSRRRGDRASGAGAGRPLAAEERRQGHRPQPDAAVGEEVPAGPLAQRQGEQLVSRRSRRSWPIILPAICRSDRFTRASRTRRGSGARGRRSSTSEATGAPVRRSAARSGPSRAPRRTSPSVASSRRSAAGPGRAGTHTGADRGRSPGRADRSRIRAARPPGDLDEGRVVEQRQGLERRVGPEPPRAGLHAAGRIEGRQERVRRGPPEERVEPAAIAVRAGIGLPRALHLTQVHHALGLGREDARAADDARQETAARSGRRRGSARRRGGAAPAATAADCRDRPPGPPGAPATPGGRSPSRRSADGSPSGSSPGP